MGSTTFPLEPVTDADTVKLVFVAAMPMELTPLLERVATAEATLGDLPWWTLVADGRAAAATVTGMGTELATASITALLDATEVTRVVVMGISGCIDERIPLGTLVRPERVIMAATGDEYRPSPFGDNPPGWTAGALWTTDVLTTEPGAHADLRARGVVALDMETAAIAAVCEARAVPWSVVRVLSDRATDGSVDEEVFHLANQDGSVDAAAVERYMAEHPERLEALAQLARQVERCLEVLTDAVLADWLATS